MRPYPPHILRLDPIMSFAVGSVQVSHKFESTVSKVYRPRVREQSKRTRTHTKDIVRVCKCARVFRSPAVLVLRARAGASVQLWGAWDVPW